MDPLAINDYSKNVEKYLISKIKTKARGIHHFYKMKIDELEKSFEEQINSLRKERDAFQELIEKLQNEFTTQRERDQRDKRFLVIKLVDKEKRQKELLEQHEKVLREKELLEQRVKELCEKELLEQREKELREKEQRVKEQQEKEQRVKEQQEKDQRAKEQQEKEQRVKEIQEKEQRDKELQEKEQRVKELQEKEQRVKELQEKKQSEKDLLLSVKLQQESVQCDEHGPINDFECTDVTDRTNESKRADKMDVTDSISYKDALMKRKRSPSPPEDNSWDCFASPFSISNHNTSSNNKNTKKSKTFNNQKNSKNQKIQKNQKTHIHNL